MSFAAIIKGVKPKNTAKWLESELPDCSRRQAWRMVQTGNVPGKFRAALIRLLDEAIAAKRQTLRDAQDDLRRLEYEEMLARAAHRKATAAAPAAPSEMAARQAHGDEPVEPVVRPLI